MKIKKGYYRRQRGDGKGVFYVDELGNVVPESVALTNLVQEGHGGGSVIAESKSTWIHDPANPACRCRYCQYEESRRGRRRTAAAAAPGVNPRLQEAAESLGLSKSEAGLFAQNENSRS